MEEMLQWIENSRDWILHFYREFIPIKAISPTKGGNGELERANFLEKRIKEWGFSVKRFDTKDSMGITRPNMVVTLPGKSNKTLWYVVHIDTVSVPSDTKWIIEDPFIPKLVDGKIFGRGVEDNGQALVSTLLALRALKKFNMVPKYTVKLALVADEEEGSTYGIQYLLSQGIFKKDDLVIVPDWGEPDGLKIEVAEKGIFWLKVTVTGKTTHASLPHKGVNAHRLAAKYITFVDELYSKQLRTREDPLFDPPYSTLEPTRCLENQPDINTIPGKHIFFYDSRLLPGIDPGMLDEILSSASKMLSTEYGLKKEHVSWEYLSRLPAAPATPSDAPVVKILSAAIEKIKGKRPEIVGIGGGTCAAFFRKASIPAVAWSTIMETAHQVNEYVLPENVTEDAKVFALVPLL